MFLPAQNARLRPMGGFDFRIIRLAASGGKVARKAEKTSNCQRKQGRW
jgi:hypothetical protein